MRFVTPVLLTLLFWSCSDVPTGPAVGTIVVTVRVSGGDHDTNFQIVVGDAPRLDVGANLPARLTTAAATQRVELQGVAANCEVAGQNPLSVAVTPGKQVEIAFDVVCATTGIEIRTRTNGFAEHSGYELVLQNRTAWSVGPNDSMLINRLQPGSYLVAIHLPGSHCTVVGTPQLQVSVANRAVTPVLFEITCIPPARTQTIAYMSHLIGGAMISLMNSDGSGALNLARGSEPDWSPNGAKLAYSTLDCDEWDYSCSGGIVVADLEAWHFTELGNGKNGYSPAWAPTGDMLAFVVSSFVESSPALKVIRLDGSPPVNIPLPIRGYVSDLDWSPDGRRIVFRCDLQGVNTRVNGDVCVVNTDGSGFVRLTSGIDHELAPAWSPDGTHIAFAFATGPDWNVAVMAADGSGIRRITTGVRPAWSPDGTRLVFDNRDGLFTIRLDGSDLKRLTNGPHSAPTWRP